MSTATTITTTEYTRGLKTIVDMKLSEKQSCILTSGTFAEKHRRMLQKKWKECLLQLQFAFSPTKKKMRNEIFKKSIFMFFMEWIHVETGTVIQNLREMLLGCFKVYFSLSQ